MYAVIDIETGGFSKTKNAICEVACIIVNDKLEEVEGYVAVIAPYARRAEIAEEEGQLCSYKPDAMAIHGILMEEIENGRPAEEVGKTLFDMLTKHGVTHIIGHNVKSFDKPWIEEFLDRFGGGFKFENSICTMIESKNKLPIGTHTITDCLNYFGISNENEHRAFGDARATLKLWLELIKR